MTATQTQHSTGWNAKAEGTQDAEQNTWSVEFAPLVMRRPAPVPPDNAGGTTGRLNFKLFRSKHAVHHAPVRSQIQSALDHQTLEKDMQEGAELLSQRKQETAARQREDESFKSIGTTQVWKSQSGRASRQATAPKQRKRQTADAGEIMGRLASERRATSRNKRPRSDEGGAPQSDNGSIPVSLGLAPETQTQATPASGPSTSRPTQKPPVPPAKKQKQNKQRRGATFVVD